MVLGVIWFSCLYKVDYVNAPECTVYTTVMRWVNVWSDKVCVKLKPAPNQPS